MNSYLILTFLANDVSGVDSATALFRIPDEIIEELSFSAHNLFYTIPKTLRPKLELITSKVELPSSKIAHSEVVQDINVLMYNFQLWIFNPKYGDKIIKFENDETAKLYFELNY